MNISRLYRQLQVKDRFVLVIFSVIVILSIYQITSSYYILLQNQKLSVLERLSVVANSCAMLINGDQHEYLSNSYQKKNDITSTNQDSVYQTIHQLLKEVRDANGITTPIYTMVYNEQTDEFEFIVTSSKIPYYRHMFVNYPSELKSNYDQGGEINVYASENGMWLSSFAPIRNKEGKTVAVVQSDENFEDFIHKARAELFKKIGVALLLFIPFTLFLYSYIKKTLERDRQQQRLLEDQNEEIQVQNETIKATNGKLEEANRIIEERNQNLDFQVKERTKELEKANEDLQTFLYRSSHDIQGPIASLKGVFHMIETDRENFDTYLKMMTRSVDQLDLRVRGINSVFEIKSKKLIKENIDIRALFDSISNSQAELTQCNNYHCEYNLGKNQIIKCDRELLKIIFKELIKNSMMYKEDKELLIKLTIKNKGIRYLELILEDNGQGVSSVVENDIFAMFKRGNEHSQGSGLGLYAVKMAIGKLKGSIKLLKRDSGTAFQIVLPTY